MFDLNEEWKPKAPSQPAKGKKRKEKNHYIKRTAFIDIISVFLFWFRFVSFCFFSFFFDTNNLTRLSSNDGSGHEKLIINSHPYFFNQKNFFSFLFCCNTKISISLFLSFASSLTCFSSKEKHRLNSQQSVVFACVCVW